MNPFAQAALSSARFAGRRAASRLSGRRPELDTIIIDVDRTLTTEDSPKAALEMLIGPKKAKEVFDSFLTGVMKGRYKISELHGAIFGELYSRGFRRQDWVGLMEDLERKDMLRKELIGSLTGICRSEGLTSILATRASQDSASWLARRFGFDFAVGSVERSADGRFEGFSLMIGASDGSDNGTRVLTKISAAAEALAEKNRSLHPSRTAVLSNDLLDALEMLRVARGILLKPSEPNTLERITQRLRLYDATVGEGPSMESELREALHLSNELSAAG
jgi:hypothetical protein